MALPLALTKDSISKLLCSNCKKVLSVPPIHLKKGQFVCGRCDSSGERVTIYEELAKLMTFPCGNVPCLAQLKWGQVVDHEENCQYKVLACPKPNCNNYYYAYDFYEHFLNCHKELVIQNELEKRRTLRDIPIENFNRDKGSYLLRHENQSYLVIVYGTCKEDVNNPGYIGSYSYNFGVFYLYKNERTRTHYDLAVTITDDDDDDTNYSWTKQLLRPYKSEYCLGCLDNSCQKGHTKKPKMFLWNKIRNYENNECENVINYSVKLFNNKPVNNAASSTLAAKLECPICYEYMSAPIYICTNGHSLCSKCKTRIKKCALCQAVIGNSRNYALEQISETLRVK